MKPPAPSSHSMLDLRDFAPARVGLGRAGASMPTKALLEFTLDHARARDAVHAAFDVSALIAGLGGLGMPAVEVSSQAGNRKDYLRRPDLGRRLDPASRQLLAGGNGGPCRLALVVGGGVLPTPGKAQPLR